MKIQNAKSKIKSKSKYTLTCAKRPFPNFLVIFSKFNQINYFIFPWNQQKTIVF